MQGFKIEYFLFLVAIIIIACLSIMEYYSIRMRRDVFFLNEFKKILLNHPEIMLTRNIIKCRCPHCKRIFTCANQTVCLFCQKDYGISPEEFKIIIRVQIALDRLIPESEQYISHWKNEYTDSKQSD